MTAGTRNRDDDQPPNDEEAEPLPPGHPDAGGDPVCWAGVVDDQRDHQ